MAETIVYEVKRRLHHDLERYLPGERIALEDGQAQRLLKSGAIAALPVPQRAAKPEPKAPPPKDK